MPRRKPIATACVQLIDTKTEIETVTKGKAIFARVKPKPGHPRVNKPPILTKRPKCIHGGTVVKVAVPPDLLATIDAAAAARGMTRAGWMRDMIERATK